MRNLTATLCLTIALLFTIESANAGERISNEIVLKHVIGTIWLGTTIETDVEYEIEFQENGELDIYLPNHGISLKGSWKLDETGTFCHEYRSRGALISKCGHFEYYNKTPGVILRTSDTKLSTAIFKNWRVYQSKGKSSIFEQPGFYAKRQSDLKKAELERQRKVELARAETARKKAEVERQRKAELARARAEAERARLKAKIAALNGALKQKAELERQRKAELERQRKAELERQRKKARAAAEEKRRVLAAAKAKAAAEEKRKAPAATAKATARKKRNILKRKKELDFIRKRKKAAEW